ncbi:TetR/AcrR family transcriptional regulator [Nocardia sp. NEAU-351]|uniref:TetR/AcrR family transcriptional regulator n=2 Tax=Nocardia bovistercoris TaxID=2785916 RepID=A0A931N7J7_9NOCA|nr:helix-turn-helix domain-containing protein [Nocardia bovistercoris]MBH0780818.1 TetR/AcrR family transcriptional regulator [Nocardia bovistercoris]
MVAGAADMLRRRGLNATSVRELAKHSGAPLGSTYHYFPGGKSELAAEAVRFADALTTHRLTKELAGGPLAGLRAFVDFWRTVLLDSDFRAGCPVLAVSVEEQPDTDDAPRRAAAAAFANWIDLIAHSLRTHGAATETAATTATLVVTALEGAVALCRAQRETTALDRTALALEAVLESALAGGARATSTN